MLHIYSEDKDSPAKTWKQFVGHVCENGSMSPGLLSAENIKEYKIHFFYIISITMVLVRSNKLSCREIFFFKLCHICLKHKLKTFLKVLRLLAEDSVQ